MSALRPLSAPGEGRGRGPSVCPHCWMVNPAQFRLCARCGASMETLLQESGGLRRTAPVQSPLPVAAAGRLTAFQRAVVGFFLAVLALGYLVQLIPLAGEGVRERPAPTATGAGGP